jgi:hypothetical protein
MRRDKLFISYSHQDKALFDEFHRHLGYWREAGQIQVWSDENLKASERWREEIDKALERAAVAVLLISSDFLNSKFIRDVELPALLGAREDGLLGIGNLFLRPSGVTRKDCLFEAKLASGETRRVHLTDYQGLNSPNTEITAFEGHARERQSALRFLWLDVLSPHRIAHPLSRTGHHTGAIRTRRRWNRKPSLFPAGTPGYRLAELPGAIAESLHAIGDEPPPQEPFTGYRLLLRTRSTRPGDSAAGPAFGQCTVGGPRGTGEALGSLPAPDADPDPA